MSDLRQIARVLLSASVTDCPQILLSGKLDSANAGAAEGEEADGGSGLWVALACGLPQGTQDTARSLSLA